MSKNSIAVDAQSEHRSRRRRGTADGWRRRVSGESKRREVSLAIRSRLDHRDKSTHRSWAIAPSNSPNSTASLGFSNPLRSDRLTKSAHRRRRMVPLIAIANGEECSEGWWVKRSSESGNWEGGRGGSWANDEEENGQVSFPLREG